MLRVLLVEDNVPFAMSLKVALEGDFSVDACHSFYEATRNLHLRPYDIVLCDYMLNGVDGLDLVSHATKLAPAPQIVMMTAFAGKEMAIKALNAGVRHLLEKPFAVKELRAILRAMEERRPVGVQDRGVGSATELCPATNSVSLQGRRIQLTPTEYSILSLLIAQQNNWVSRDRVEEVLWQANPHGSRNILDTHIYNLRKKVPDLKDRLQVMRGKGFLLKSLA